MVPPFAERQKKIIKTLKIQHENCKAFTYVQPFSLYADCTAKF